MSALETGIPLDIKMESPKQVMEALRNLKR
jgi:hypothetical protein